MSEDSQRADVEAIQAQEIVNDNEVEVHKHSGWSFIEHSVELLRFFLRLLGHRSITRSVLPAIRWSKRCFADLHRKVIMELVFMLT